MRALLILFVFIVGCKSKDEAPPQPPAESPTPVVSASPEAPKLPEYCSKEGKTIECEAQLGHETKAGCYYENNYHSLYFTQKEQARSFALTKGVALELRMKAGKEIVGTAGMRPWICWEI